MAKKLGLLLTERRPIDAAPAAQHHVDDPTHRHGQACRHMALSRSGGLRSDKPIAISSSAAFPLGLSMVGEMVEGVLASQSGMPRRQMLDQLTAVVLSVFDRYAVPPSIGEGAWLAARSDLAHRLDLVGGHAPKRVMDISEPLAEAYFAMMPIREKLRGQDFPTTRNYLRVCATSTMN